VSKPTLTIIAGPNGSGKSTLTRNLRAEGVLIDPDAIAREMSPENPQSVAVNAGRTALAMAESCIVAKRDFVQETTLSGHSASRLIDRAKLAGYKVDLRYVCLKSAAANQARVAKRVEEGGHSVPAEDVARRYERSLAALPSVISKVDSATLYDNSSREGHRVVARFAAGRLLFLQPDAPDWAKTAVSNYEEKQHDRH
jgi:predicted ABC-type ATPase